MGIPSFGFRAYALLFLKHGTAGRFKQAELDWMVGPSMRKKIFSLLVHSGWIQKQPHNTYVCVKPGEIVAKALAFRVPEIMKEAKKEYAFTGLSAIEIWSDFAYVQRGIEKSPYFIKVLKKDLAYWKNFFNRRGIPNYVDKGSTVGEYVIFIPVKNVKAIEKQGFKVEGLKEAMKHARSNDIYSYAYRYMRKKYGRVAD